MDIQSNIEDYDCCDGMEIEEDKSWVCISCGVIHASVYKNEYIDYYLGPVKDWAVAVCFFCLCRDIEAHA